MRRPTNFLQSASGAARERYDRFCRDNHWWLEDYVLFSSLRERYGEQPWNSWPEEIVRRRPDAMAKLHTELREQLDQERFLQFAFFEQWAALRSYCRERGIRVIGDVAIFVSYDSADVWTHPEIFRLKPDLSPEVVAGVPPDAFSETGQRWGNPLYDWDALRSRGYSWWIKRMRWAIETCDIVRLDHFRGFEACWEIPADEPTAINGRWVAGPNASLFKALKSALGKLPFIAEDLGYITREVHDLRKNLEIPGMKVLQFGFGNRGRPHISAASVRARRRCVHRHARQRHHRGLVELMRHRRGEGGCIDLSGNWRGWSALGVHSSGADFGGKPERDTRAGRAGTRQRCAHECSQPDRRQLVMAIAARRVDRASWRKSWLPWSKSPIATSA